MSTSRTAWHVPVSAPELRNGDGQLPASASSPPRRARLAVFCDLTNGSGFATNTSHTTTTVNTNGAYRFDTRALSPLFKSRRLERHRNRDKYKTTLCNTWTCIGSCPYGRKCLFAHGEHELRPQAVPDTLRMPSRISWRWLEACEKLHW